MKLVHWTGMFVLFALVLLSAAARAQSTAAAGAPATPVARQFAAWLAAFNQADRARLAAYHAQSFPFAVASRDVDSLDHEVRLRGATGGFELKKSEPASPTELVAVLKARSSSEFARARMRVDSAAPHNVVAFEIHPGPTPLEFLTAEDLAAGAGPVDAARRTAVVDTIAHELDAGYVYPDVGSKMVKALLDHLDHGDYDSIVDGDQLAQRLTQDLQAVSHDRHLRILYGRHPQGPPPRRDLAAMNYGFGVVERLPNNVAHVVIDGFPEGDEMRAAIARLLSPVADADALIVDLRNNGGGSPKTVALIASYLFDGPPVHLLDMIGRDGTVEPSWTLTDVKGKCFGGTKPLYVLTSARTFSGGEELAYDLQTLRHATVIGETTGGGAHPGGPHRVDDWFAVVVPEAHPRNPVTKTNWEGTGVKPDVAIKAEEALAEAQRRAARELAARRSRSR